MENRYQMSRDENSLTIYERKEVHLWQPPCSCGVELGEALDYTTSLPEIKGEVHSWQPPCSCGVSLDDVVED